MYRMQIKTNKKGVLPCMGCRDGLGGGGKFSLEPQDIAAALLFSLRRVSWATDRSSNRISLQSTRNKWE